MADGRGWPVNPLGVRNVARMLNPYPSVVFRAPEVAEAYQSVGLRPGMMGYFAGRAAPMGAVPADVVIATFYNFQPALVRSVIPEAWTLASPTAILQRRLEGVDAGLRRIVGEDLIAAPEVKEAAALACAAAEACGLEGRPLFAGHASMSCPDAPHLALWHALTLLREYRGDGHITALQSAGYSGCEALAMHLAVGVLPEAIARSRGWSPDEWAAALDALRSRGWVDDEGKATPAGRAARELVELQTDRLSARPFDTLGEDRCRRLGDLVGPMAARVAESLFSMIPSSRT